MKSQATTSDKPAAIARDGWPIRSYYDLTKPRVVGLIVFTAIVGMFLATNEMVPFVRLVLAAAGIGLGAASGAVLNHVLDRNADAVMARTQARPLPTGAVGTLGALILALTLAILSMVLLVMWVNFLTAALTFASMIGYGVIYTVFLKYATPQNIVIGGIGLGCGDRFGVYRCIVTFFNHFLLDSTALLGAGALSTRGIRECWYTHAAGNSRYALHKAADSALHRTALRCHAIAIWHTNVWYRLFGWQCDSEYRIHLLCCSFIQKLQ